MAFTTLAIARAWEAGGATAAPMFNFGATQPGGFAFTPTKAPAAGGLVRRLIVQDWFIKENSDHGPFPLMKFILCRAMTLPLNVAASCVPSATPLQNNAGLWAVAHGCDGRRGGEHGSNNVIC